jgi:hypothetical protein
MSVGAEGSVPTLRGSAVETENPQPGYGAAEGVITAVK